jgi:exo-beta-1,3-glucanase (GH17 family)
MVAAGLSSAVTITVAETGYPTDAARSEATQAAVLKDTIASVENVRRTYGVTDLRWFCLRDANTASGQLENGYGLLRDEYSPRPAFSAYQQIISAEGA